MVRETRYLLVGNLPETTTEDEIAEYFKRFGKIQKVKLERKPEGSSDSDEKEEGAITSLTATVAFTDIKSASTAHKAEKKIGNNVLSSEYSSGFGATGSVVKRTHEPEIFPRAPPPPGPFTSRKGFEEEADGFDVYYGLTPNYSEPPYPGSPFSERGRPRERWIPGGPFPGRGAKWAQGTSRQFSDSGKDTFEKPKSTSVPASSPASHASSKRSKKKKKKSKSTDRSRSRSSGSSSRSSSSESESGSQSSSKERGKSMSGKGESKDTEIEPGEREPLGVLIRKLPLRSSDTSLRDGLFHEYKKYGKITAVQVSGVNEGRYAIISFKQAEDAAKALDASRDKRFFGTLIQAEQHEGLEGEDGDFLTPEAQLDEHSPKATRTLFLGNLDKEISIEELKEKLEKYGEILDVDVKRQGAVTAYAFIQFTDITSVVKALKDLDGTTWGSTKLKVGFGKSMATPVVWLGNLADTVHETFLFKQFARFGALSHTVVDREEHKALVFFMNVESAQYALPEMRNRIWNGKKIHIDYASRDCQEAFYKKMENSGQLRPGERPDARSMQKKLAESPHWDEGYDPNFKRGGFNQFGRGRGRFQRGRGFFRGRGGPGFEGLYPPDEFSMRKRQIDEYSQGSGQYMDDDYEQALRDYGHSQRERHERASQSPPPYDDIYYERGSQSGHDYDPYDKHRFASYRSLSPGSDRDMDIADELGRYKRTPSDERFYYKEKLYEEGRLRERSHSSDSEQRYRIPSEVISRQSRSRSPTLKRTKDLPISYRSHTPPTPTEEENYYPSDNSPTDFDSAYRKYTDYKKRPSSGSVEGDRKTSVLVNTGLRREIEAKSEERSSRKRSYDQLSPKRSDSLHRIERQHSRGSRGDSLYEFDRGEKLSAKELIAKVQRLRAEVNERLGVKDSPSSSSNSDIDPSTLTESDLIKLHREKQKLVQKLTLLDDSGNLSGNESDSRHGSSSKKARMDLKYLQKSESMTKQELKDRYKKELREYKKSKSVGDVKKDFLDYSEEDSFSLNSPRDYPPGFMPKKRRKLDSEGERKRSYRSRHDDDQAGFSSDDDKDRNELVRQSSAHGDSYSKSRTLSSLDARLESAEFSSHSREESRRVSSGSDNNKEHSEHSGHSRRRHKKRDNHITPLIPLGDDSMPDPETADPRSPCEKCERPLVLPLPDFAQFIQFSPLPSPHHSPERYSDLRAESGRDKMSDSAGNSDPVYQSPCFSPQSSSSKTHSPSQSPNGSGSDTKVNTNSDSGSSELPPGYPTEQEQIDPEANKTDSLDSAADPSKSPEKSKHDDSFSDNNSDIENLGADNLSIEERIRQLDEKWNKAQAVAAATPKSISDVETMVNSSSAGSPLLTPFTTAPVITTASASPTTSSLYSKYKIRKRNDQSGSGTEKDGGPSEIVQTVLSKSSIFDQDSKRLGQTDEPNKDASPASGNSPKLYGAWNKTEIKENPMVTLPGSLLDRLGQGNNGSFPTLNVTTTFPSVTSVSLNRTDSANQSVYSYESRLSKLSPLPSLEIPNVSDKSTTASSPLNKEEKLIHKTDSESSLNSPRVEKNGLGLDTDIKKKELEKSPVMPKSILKNRSNSDLTSADNIAIRNGTETSFSNKNPSFVETVVKSEKKSGDIELNLLQEPVKTESTQAHSPKLNGDIGKIVNDASIDTSQKTEKSANSEGKPVNDESVVGSNEVKVKSENSIKNEVESAIEPNKNVEVEKADAQEKMDVSDIKADNISLKEETKCELKSESTEVKMDVDTPQESVKPEQEPVPSKSTLKDKHSSKSSKDSSKEPSHKKQKLSKDGKEKRSDSSHKDDKHKKKESEKKSESTHKSSNEKKDEKHKDKHKTKSDKDKKEGEKKPKEEKKESKDKKKSDKKEKEKKEGDKDVKDDKSEKHSKDKKEEKTEEKKASESESKETKEKTGEKKEKTEKKHEKKEGHKHDKHKSPDKKSKSSHKKEENSDNKESDDKPKETTPKESLSKEGSSKESEKERKDGDKEKQEKADKKSSDSSSSSSKKEHKSSSSHKSKKGKDDSSSKNSKEESKSSKGETKTDNSEAKKSKDEETKKVKDDHNEHKKKDESTDRNNKDSPDKNKDLNRKDSLDKKSSEKVKEKSAGSDKCKEDNSKSKEKENKDKDPDHTKSKGNGNSNSSASSEACEKPKAQSIDAAKASKSKTETDKDDSKKSDSKKEEKNKDTDVSKNSNTPPKKSTKDTDNHKKNSQKSEKTGKNKESKLKEKLDCDKSKKESSKKKDPPAVYNGLTEEDLAIFAKFADESSLSMYAKVKRRSTEKKLHHDREHEEQKKLLSEYKKNQKSSKKVSLSDITESSEVSTDDERKKPTPKNRKKFAFSSDDSDSSTDTGADILQKKDKSKPQMKKPKRILDIYSSDSEEEEMKVKTPPKSSSSTKKKKAEVHRESENKFEFDSISDSDNKTSATQQAKVKTKPKPEKKQSKSKSDLKSQPKSDKKDDQKAKKPKLQRKDFNFKDLFSDDSDDSMLSDSDSDSDIMMTPKTKKKIPSLGKNDKNKKTLPRGSSIYTSSEDSDTDEEFKPMSPPKSTVLPKRTEKKVNHVFKSPTRKDHESDSMTSDTELKSEKSKVSLKNSVQSSFENSMDSDSVISEPEVPKKNKLKAITEKDKSLKKLQAEKSREQIEKDLHKLNNKKFNDIITNDPYSGLTKREISKVYSETVYEKDSLLANLSNKDNLPPILTDINKEPLFNLDVDSVRNDIPTLKDIQLDHVDDKSLKVKNKKHKKENKKKKKSKDKGNKDFVRENDNVNSKNTDMKQEKHPQKSSSSENLMQDSDLENMNAVDRNLFDDMKGMKSPEGKKSKNKSDSKAVVHTREESQSQSEKITESDITDAEKKKAPKADKTAEHNKKQNTNSAKSDVFDFQEDDNRVKPIKESHMKITKQDAIDEQLSDHEAENANNVPVEIQGVEIEYRTDEQDYKDEGFNVCPVVETTEVVIENASSDNEKEKPKPRKRKGRKNSAKENQSSLTEEAVSSLSKEEKVDNSLIMQFEAPVSNENELIIDEGASLHVEDETEKAVESIVNDETDETAKAVESILLDGMPAYTISEPVEPTPTLDQNYLQPEFAPGLPSTVPQVGTEVETATTNSPLKGRKGRKGRRTKSGQGDTLLNENSNLKPFDLLGDSSLASDLSSSLDQNDDDDDDDGKLQIDFDPPKPEAKQKKQRKPKQTKGNKMKDAVALAAENKLDNLFPNFNEEKKDELNRDSLSSENSELERSKHEDLLFINREDQRHDSDMMSPDERSTSDDLTSPDLTKPKAKRGRKPKNKDQVTATLPRTNSPRANSRALSPRSPRNSFDAKSPEPKVNGPKNLIIDEGSKPGSNVFDFDENDESNLSTSAAPVVATGKQRKPRQKKKGEPGLQSPESRSLFSSPENDKLVIGSPEPKGMFSPEHKGQISSWDKKPLFPQSLQPEEQKLEVKVVADDKPPEPLFKAFFEAKSKTEKETDKTNLLLARKGIQDAENKQATAAKIMSNVDKTIEDVSKGLFESTDDEGASHLSEQPGQKKRQGRKSKDEELKSPLKSPIPKSPSVKSPVPKSPLKSPVMSQMTSPPPSIPASHQPPLVLPGMGIGQPSAQAQIGEPKVAAPVSMFGQISSPPSRVPVLEAARSQSVSQPVASAATVLASPNKPFGAVTTVQSTITTSSVVTSSSVAQDLRKVDGVAETVLKSSMPGFLVPGIAASSAANVLQGISAAACSAPITVVSSSVMDASRRPLPSMPVEKLTSEQQKQQSQQQALEQQKLFEQKQAELQRQQDLHVKRKEQELKQMEQQRLLEEHKKLQERIKNKEMQDQRKSQEQLKSREEVMKKEQEKKRLEEQYKMLQEHHELLQKEQARMGLVVSSQPSPQELLSPGALQRQRPGLPSPSATDKAGPRPPVSAHHPMPPSGPFGLPIRPGQFPQHLTAAQIQAMQHLVQPLGSDKPPTNAEMVLKHQQLQQQIAAQAQKAQAQALAEQQAQLAKQQATQAKQGGQQAGQGKPGKGAAASKKGLDIQHVPTTQSAGLPPGQKEGAPLPGSQEAANQLTAQIKQQLAMQQAQQQAQAAHQSHPGSHGGPPQGPQGVGSWPMPHRPEGPRQPGPPQGPVPVEARTSMPGPVPMIGGNPQQVQRVSPNPPNKSPTVAQTAPNMVLGFSQHQTAAPRAPSPAVAKTSERQAVPGAKWSATSVPPRPGQPDVRPRPPSSEAIPPASRPDIWGVNGPQGLGMNATPRPAHQQQPDTLQLKRVLDRPGSDKFLQQHEKHIQELQRQEFLKHQQEMQRQQQLRDQALHAQAQKEVQIHKEREEREKREAQANLTSQGQSDPRQSPAVRMGYPFVEPRPPSRDGKMQQSPAIVDPRDPRFTQQFPGHHPADLRLGSSQASAFSPAAGNSGDPSHMYSQAELQRLQNGLIPAYPHSLLMRDPHLIPGHAPYMLPGHLAYMAQQMEHQHLVDGRPPSRGTSRPPSNQPVHTVSPTQQAPGENRNQNRGQGQTMGPPARDPHPGDGSLLSLLQRYPVMWQGVLGLKNDQCVVQMHFISGFQPLVKMSLPQQAPDGTVQPLRIAQRMRLEQAQLEGVAKRMQMEKDYCMMLALPCGRDHTDIYQQTRAMSTGFIQYLQQKQAAGIVNVADPGSQQPAYVVHIFPPCEFSQTTLSRLGFDLLYQVKDLAHLIVIIATVA